MVWDDEFLSYDLGPDHPLNPVRLDLTMRLARELGVLDRPACDCSRRARADEDLLTLVHDPDVPGRGPRGARAGRRPSGTGSAPPDNPVFDGMYEAAALIAGGSVLAARAGRARAGADRAVNIAGGLHHAMRDRASGFCVFNDPAVAIARLLDLGAERIAYVDVDVHHGDGVQAAFYDDPRVLTVSLHQTPLTLFPGTGFPDETGDAATAMGSAVNSPCRPAPTTPAGCAPSTPSCRRVLRAFRPQILVTQCGCDTHHEDPLADLALTVDGQRATYRALHELAHELCDGRGSPSAAAATGWSGACRGPGRTCSPTCYRRPLDPATAIPPAWRRRRRARAACAPAADGHDRRRRRRRLGRGPVSERPRRPGDHCAPGAPCFPLLRPDPDDPAGLSTARARRMDEALATAATPTGAGLPAALGGRRRRLRRRRRAPAPDPARRTPTRIVALPRPAVRPDPLPALLRAVPADPRAGPVPLHRTSTTATGWRSWSCSATRSSRSAATTGSARTHRGRTPRSRSSSRTPTRAAGSARSCSSTSPRRPASAGIKRFVAEVLAENSRMVRVFQRRRLPGQPRVTTTASST